MRILRFVVMAVVLVSGVVYVFASSTQSPTSTPTTETGTLLFATSFTSSQGWMTDKRQIWDGGDCPNGTETGFADVQAGVAGGGNWAATARHTCDEVIDDANRPEGEGGKGFRHYRSDGVNANGGGIQFSWDGRDETHQDMSICYWMRYSSGFAFDRQRNPQYIKDWYHGVGGPKSWVLGFEGGGWGITNVAESTNRGGSADWTHLYRGGRADGSWHQLAAFVDLMNRRWRIWLDGKKILDVAQKPVFSTHSDFALLGSNQRLVDNDQDGDVSNDDSDHPDGYTDFDDIKVYTGISTNGGKAGC